MDPERLVVDSFEHFEDERLQGGVDEAVEVLVKRMQAHEFGDSGFHELLEDVCLDESTRIMAEVQSQAVAELSEQLEHGMALAVDA